MVSNVGVKASKHKVGRASSSVAREYGVGMEADQRDTHPHEH